MYHALLYHVYIHQPLQRQQAVEEVCKSPITVQVYCRRSPVQCPFQVYWDSLPAA